MVAELSNQDPLYLVGVAATTTASAAASFVIGAQINYAKELLNVKSKAVSQNFLVEAGFSAEEVFEATVKVVQVPS